MEYNYLIIGGGIAGGTALRVIHEKDPNASLALLTQEPHRPYERPPLSKDVLAGRAKVESVFLHPADYYFDEHIELYLNTRVMAINPRTKSVTLAKGTPVQYGKLLLATGGRPRGLSVAGNDLPNVFTLRSIEDAENIQALAGKGKHALVVGGSFMGAEVAASLAQLGTRVTMVFPEKRLLERIVPQELSQHLHDKYTQRGVQMVTGATLDRLEGVKAVERAVLNHGEMLDVDLVVMGVGIKLNTELAQKADLAVRKSDHAILVDENLRTSDPDIFAAGDIVAWPDATFEQRLQVEHWDVARQQGIRAGKNMTGENETYTVLPYFFSDIFDFSFEVWGHLEKWDRTVLRGSLKEESFAFYYFKDARLTGVLAVNCSENERDSMQALVKARPCYEKIGDDLKNERIELSQMAAITNIG